MINITSKLHNQQHPHSPINPITKPTSSGKYKMKGAKFKPPKHLPWKFERNPQPTHVFKLLAASSETFSNLKNARKATGQVSYFFFLLESVVFGMETKVQYASRSDKHEK